MKKARKSADQLERETKKEIERIAQRILEQDYRYDMEEWKNVLEMMGDFANLLENGSFATRLDFFIRIRGGII